MPPLSVALRSLFTLFSLNSFILFLYYSLDCPTFFSLTISLPFPLLFSFLSLLFSYLSLSCSPSFLRFSSLHRGNPAHDYSQELRLHSLHHRQRHGRLQIISWRYVRAPSLPSLPSSLSISLLPSIYSPPYIPPFFLPLCSSVSVLNVNYNYDFIKLTIEEDLKCNCVICVTYFDFKYQ